MNTNIKKILSGVIAVLILAIISFCVLLIIKPVDYTSDKEALHEIANVGAILISHAKEKGRFPEELRAINGDYFDGNPLARAILDQKFTAYSQPQSYPASSLHMLLARPTEHGMVVVYADGSAQRFVWQK
jgi:hypothetical protein